MPRVGIKSNRGYPSMEPMNTKAEAPIEESGEPNLILAGRSAVLFEMVAEQMYHFNQNERGAFVQALAERFAH